MVYSAPVEMQVLALSLDTISWGPGRITCLALYIVGDAQLSHRNLTLGLRITGINPYMHAHPFQSHAVDKSALPIHETLVSAISCGTARDSEAINNMLIGPAQRPVVGLQFSSNHLEACDGYEVIVLPIYLS